MSQRHIAYVNARGEFIDNGYSNNWCGWEQRATCPRCREMGREPKRFYRVVGEAHGEQFDAWGFRSAEAAEAYASSVIDGDLDSTIEVLSPEGPEFDEADAIKFEMARDRDAGLA